MTLFFDIVSEEYCESAQHCCGEQKCAGLVTYSRLDAPFVLRFGGGPEGPATKCPRSLNR